MHSCVVEYFWSAIGLCMHSPSANNPLKSFLSISQKFFAWSWLDLNSSAANSLNSTAMRTFCLPARSFPLTNKKLLPLSSLLPLQPSNVHNSPLLRSRKNILPFPTPPPPPSTRQALIRQLRYTSSSLNCLDPFPLEIVSTPPSFLYESLISPRHPHLLCGSVNLQTWQDATFSSKANTWPSLHASSLFILSGSITPRTWLCYPNLLQTTRYPALCASNHQLQDSRTNPTLCSFALAS